MFCARDPFLAGPPKKDEGLGCRDKADPPSLETCFSGFLLDNGSVYMDGTSRSLGHLPFPNSCRQLCKISKTGAVLGMQSHDSKHSAFTHLFVSRRSFSASVPSQNAVNFPHGTHRAL